MMAQITAVKTAAMKVPARRNRIRRTLGEQIFDTVNIALMVIVIVITLNFLFNIHPPLEWTVDSWQ